MTTKSDRNTPFDYDSPVSNMDEWMYKGKGNGVGDLSSDKKGTGARFNHDKAALELIPVPVIHQSLKRYGDVDAQLEHLLTNIHRWSNGYDPALQDAMADLTPMRLASAAKVLEFGKAKYAAWNWAKGMSWSVVLGCILRHATAIGTGEEIDQDSGLPHWAHIDCNLIFLDYYRQYYKEGDDRLKTIGVEDDS